MVFNAFKFFLFAGLAPLDNLPT